MSLRRSCVLIETAPESWFIVLGNHEDAHLTRRDATAWGPLSSFEECENVLDEFPNPGGYNVIDINDSARYLENAPEVQGLIDHPWNPYTMTEQETA
ncbi:MAG: hypothetical protein LUQ37_10030 [Methanoregulaceae archaeon]|jgi:hypothetical protein|nr:hypothetical protein [Methanoregulaceae archaeon]